MSSFSARVTILHYQLTTGSSMPSGATVRRQMAFLRAARYHVLSLRELVTGLEGRASIPKRAVHLTFDGGANEFAADFWPTLRVLEYPATVFLATDLIGQTGRMDAQVLRRLQDEGVRFGSLSRTNRVLAGLDDESLDDEVAQSRRTLMELLGRDVFAFSYPNGEVNRAVLRAVGNAGYRLGFTRERNRATRGTHPLLLPRYTMNRGSGLLGLFWRLRFQPPGRPVEPA